MTNVVEGGIKSFHPGQDSDIQLKVEFFGGADIDKCCTEICALANRLQVIVIGKFNGVDLMARPGGSPRVLRANWDRESNSKRQYKIATCHPEPAPTPQDAGESK